jgi:hypothetical protein
MKRITYLAAAGALVATSGLGAWAANAATDDSPAAHVRTTAKHGADDPAGHRHHHGADDRAGHHRHASTARHHGSTGTEPGDDNGGVTDTPEPGDDNGGVSNTPEPGDDNGGVSDTPEPGDDNGGDSGSGSDDGGGHHGGGDDHGSDG